MAAVAEACISDGVFEHLYLESNLDGSSRKSM